jgi:hypothetical protein
MTNCEITKTFFTAISLQTKNLILDNIAAHYGITRAAALDEVTHDDAEHLLDYVTGPGRDFTHLFMRQAGLSPSTATQ